MKNHYFKTFVMFLLLGLATHVGQTHADYVYVTNDIINTVSRVNISTEVTYPTITVGSEPANIAITPNGRYAYVANYVSDTVSVIDTFTNAVVKTIAVGSGAWDVAVSPNGNYVYVTNSNDDTVSIIETSTNTVIAPLITVDTGPVPVAFTPDGNYAYVGNAGSNTVSVIQTSNPGATPATITGVTSPGDIAITPNGLYAYVTSYSTVVTVIGIPSNNIVTTITVGDSSAAGNGNGVVFTPDGNYAYVTNFNDDSVSVIQTSNFQVIQTITTGIGAGPSGIAMSPSGQFAYVTNANDNTISVIDIANNNIVSSVIPVSGGNLLYGIAVLQPGPAGSLNGFVVKTKFASQTDRIHKLRWTQSSDPNVVGYNLYRNGVLIYIVSTSGPFQYADHNRRPNVVDTYALTTFNNSGTESIPLTVQLE